MISKAGHEKLAKFHGLDPVKNTDEDVDNYLTNDALTADDLEELENRAKAGDSAVAELLNRDLEKYANRIGSDPKAIAGWKNALVSNRKTAIEMLEALPEVPTTTTQPVLHGPVHNRRTAGTPGAIESGEDKDRKKEEVRAGKVSNRARELMEKNPRLTHRVAFDTAEREIPSE